eukprot:9393639-Heterocapsa_arctica.AAC.1
MKDGGVGFRTPDEIAIPAFAASRFTFRPGAIALFKQLEDIELATEGALLKAYDDRTSMAEDRLYNSC